MFAPAYSSQLSKTFLIAGAAAASITFVFPALLIAISYFSGGPIATQILFAYLFPTHHVFAIPAAGLIFCVLAGARICRTA